MQTQLIKKVGEIIETVTQENLLGFKITKASIKQKEKMITLHYQLQKPKTNFTLAYNIHIPKNIITTEFKRIGYTINEILKYFHQNLKEYTLSELIRETPTKWGLVFDLVLDPTLNPVKTLKHVILIPDELYYIKITEDLNNTQFTITIHKKHEKLILNKLQLEATLRSLNRLKELALYDTNYKYKWLIYTIRLIPILLTKYSVHTAFKFNDLTLTIKNTTMTIKAEKGLKLKTMKLPLETIKNQTWQEYLIRGIYAEVISEL